ncbi:predicted protein, partial [Nematostella vectensis]
VPRDVRDGNWHHIVFTWSAAVGEWRVFIDGALSGQGSSYATGYSISSGHFTVGQDQDAFGGAFDTDQSFLGSMVGVNMWSRVLTEDEIALLASSWCVPLEGDIVKWTD